jgi:hypothetical protein
MKFTAAIVAAIAVNSAVTDVAAFGVHSKLAVRRSSGPSTLRMSLDDLQSKLLTDKPAPAAAAAVSSKKSQPSRKPKPTPPAPVPVPVPVPEPVLVAEVTPAKKGKKKEKYVDLGDVATPAAPKAKVQAPKPVPAPISAPAPPAKKQDRPNRAKVVVATPPPKPVAAKAEAIKDPNAGPLGVALGAAPLLVAPLVALTAARGALGKTAARREQIQEEIAAKERAAKAKASATASVDSGGVVGALVSVLCESNGSGAVNLSWINRQNSRFMCDFMFKPKKLCST